MSNDYDGVRRAVIDVALADGYIPDDAAIAQAEAEDAAAQTRLDGAIASACEAERAGWDYLPFEEKS